MSAVWIGIAVTAVGCFALKVAGLSVPERVLAHPLAVRAGALIPIGLLGALIAVQVFGGDHALELDARVAGLAVAAVLLTLRLPFLPVVVAAAAAAALLRTL